MPNVNFYHALRIITDLIEGQRIAGPHYYEVIWIEDHFVCRQMGKVDKNAYLIIKLRAQDINEGMTNTQWDIVAHRLRVLIKEGVIK